MKNHLWAATAALTLGIASHASGALLFDMGPTAAITSPANSPGHATGAVPAGETTWTPSSVRICLRAPSSTPTAPWRPA